MEPRRIADLAQLTDTKFFEEVAKGLTLIHENTTRIWESVEVLAKQKYFRTAEILKNLAMEEAAKYLILLDAVRCPRKPQSKRFTDQLKKFGDHLARGLYADICDWRPVNLKEVKEGIERECEAYYLDGPNGVDWIFRNNIKRAREEALYVDYVAYEGMNQWLSPKTQEAVSARMFFSEPVAIHLVRALHEVGFSNPRALAVIAQTWRPKVFNDESDHIEFDAAVRETLAALEQKGLLELDGDDECSTIYDRWPFPLYAFPMKVIEVDKKKLRDIQDRWHPDI